MIVTRFNPSCNGGLHLGHVYMVLINEQIAHEAGGRFIVRFDDCGEDVIARAGADGARAIAKSMIADLEWLGIPVDSYTYQSEMIERVHRDMMDWGVLAKDEPQPVPTPEWLGGAADRLMYPYTPRKTPEKVIMDEEQGVNLLIRGEDLLTEFSLYEYYRERFGMLPLRHVYLPQLVAPYGGMGKSLGGYKVSEYRAGGMKPEDVHGLVARSCLHWWANGWHLENVKQAPRLEI